MSVRESFASRLRPCGRQPRERALLIISEAAKALPDDLLNQHPSVDWIGVRSLGNVLRHEYHTVRSRHALGNSHRKAAGTGSCRVPNDRRAGRVRSRNQRSGRRATRGGATPASGRHRHDWSAISEEHQWPRRSTSPRAISSRHALPAALSTSRAGSGTASSSATRPGSPSSASTSAACRRERGRASGIGTPMRTS